LAVLAPTGCVLWFMASAMDNERLAVRQRLTQTYRQHLRQAADDVGRHWAAQRSGLTGETPAGPETFAREVRGGNVDSLVIFDESGEVAYPVEARPGLAAPSDSAWDHAAQLEADPATLDQAADAYAGIAAEAATADLKALALQARVRCLIRAGRPKDAISVLAGPLSSPALRAARGPQGRLIAPGAMLLSLQLTVETGGPASADAASALATLLNDYADTSMPANQRRFLMRELAALAPDVAKFPTLAAEDIAAEYLAERKTTPEPARLTAAGIPGVWHAAGEGGATVAIFRQESLIERIAAAAGLDDPPAGTTLRLAPPADGDKPADEAFLSMPAGQEMPGWELQLQLVGENPFTAAADRQRVAYLWTGTLGIAVTIVFALALLRYLARQVRLTRLRNDLIATVSHELKTPLASMRAMVDTLRAGRCVDREKELEYFGLLAKENARLSRLIDNFLTFSRMERNKQAFEAEPLDPAQLVAEAVESVAGRFDQPGCELEVDAPDNLPTIVGDRDALVTVLLNLLSNAQKYSGEHKHVAIRAYANDADVCIEVADSGIGLSRRAMRNVFDRFYQVDQRVSRSVGGCGLGLSIVKFVVDAHGGSVHVASKPDEGSTFTVRLPRRPASATTPEDS